MGELISKHILRNYIIKYNVLDKNLYGIRDDELNVNESFLLIIQRKRYMV